MIKISSRFIYILIALVLLSTPSLSQTKKNDDKNAQKKDNVQPSTPPSDKTFKELRRKNPDSELFSQQKDDETPTIKENYNERFTRNYFKIETASNSLWNGKHWKIEDYPLKIFIKVQDKEYFNSGFRQYIDYAMKLWEKADPRISLVYTLVEKNADIVICFEENLMYKYEDNYLGLTTYDLNNDKSIQKATIEISLLKYNEEQLSNGEMKITIIHELGHALGLGHSDNLFDIMFPFIDSDVNADMNFNELSDADKSAIKSVVNLGSPYEKNKLEIESEEAALK